MTAPITITGEGVFSPKLRQASIVRKQVSQGGAGYLGIEIRGDKGLVDPDAIDLRIFFKEINDDYAENANSLGKQVAVLDALDIKKDSTGRYFYEMGPALTAAKGHLTATWMYEVDGRNFSYVDHLQILEPMPVYDSLREYEKTVIQQVSWMFGDLFDSTEGGANLTENFQTHFTYERMAQLMTVAVIRMGTTGAPVAAWSVGEGNGNEVPQQLHGLMVLATYLEVLRHFMRSYVEQPDFKNMSVTYTDRRDYLQRWQSIYQDEKQDYLKMLAIAKRKLTGLGQGGALLVSGGIYGSGSGIFQYGTYVAQVRSMRFAPAASAITYVNTVNRGGSGPWGGSA